MSLENFLSFLQQLLTMVDPNDANSVALAKISLQSVTALAHASHKANPITLRAMMYAEMHFTGLVAHREDFAGVPGEYTKNQVKRQRLANVIAPGC